MTYVELVYYKFVDLLSVSVNFHTTAGNYIPIWNEMLQFLISLLLLKETSYLSYVLIDILVGLNHSFDVQIISYSKWLLFMYYWSQERYHPNISICNWKGHMEFTYSMHLSFSDIFRWLNWALKATHFPVHG